MSRHHAGLTGNGQQCFSGDCSSGNCTLVSHAEENVEVGSRHPGTSHREYLSFCRVADIHRHQPSVLHIHRGRALDNSSIIMEIPAD